MRPYTVALTGGIASGKTAVSDALCALGASVIDTDILAREVVAPGSDGLQALVASFGSDVLAPDGSLNRRALRERAFASEADRARLNAIVHPRIRALAGVRLQDARGPYALLVVPLLVESGQYDWVQRVLVVDVDEATQLKRLTARDGIDEPLARSMLAAQATRAQRLAGADDVIVNNADLAALRVSAQTAHRRFVALAQRDAHHEIRAA